MADSDDEHERRRARDKFRRERSDYQERRDDRNRRDERAERGSRREYRDYDPQRRRERYSPLCHDVSPPIKRMRRDWDMDKPLTQPPMMTFKQFLGSQDDRIDDQEAVKKYNEYKLEFKRQQINEFFLNHKEEEWFKSKYHPEECVKRLAEQRAALKKRLDVFMEMLDKGSIDAVSVDAEKSDEIVRLLDSVVIKLEGGTDFDLKSLDEPYEEEKAKESESAQEIKAEEKAEEEKKKEVLQEEKEKKSPKPRRKRTRNYSSDENDDDDDDEEEEDDSSADSESEVEPTVVSNNDEDAETVTLVDEGPDSKKEEEKERSDKEESHSEQDCTEKVISEEKTEVEKVEDKTEIDEEKMEEKESEIKKEETCEAVDSPPLDDSASKEDGEPKPRPLHKTKSVFLRNLAPTIAKQEVEAMCRRYSGLLRVAISDPQPERQFFRRGWVTFERTVNIKEICLNLSNIRLRDCELRAIVNRDLSRRVRSVDGITAHKQVVLSDIKLATRMIQNLDEQRGLWEDTGKKSQQQEFGLVSRNPLLKNITDYLIEEASAEEEELLGMTEQEENKQSEDNPATLERDKTLIKVLDRLILYLRIVHSVDYYNSCEYANEDEMPSRCGIIHARGSPPSVKVTQREINEYISHFEQKATVFLQPQVKLSDEEATILGKKDPIAEVEKFVQANTQELSKDKWLCPLSGKKFKGAEFVRKHIFNKHSIKVEEVRKEVKYFNNYLIDPKRPQLPPHPSNRSFGPGPYGNRDEMYPIIPPYHGGANGSYPPSPYPNSYGGAHRGFQSKSSFGGPFGGRSSFSSGYSKRSNYGRRSDPREVVGYHDLDKPQDLEMF